MTTRTLVTLLIAACLGLAGCAGAAAEDPAPRAATGGMGGGMGGEDGGSGGMVEGFVAAPGNGVLEIGSGSRVTSDGVVVSRVVAPADGWVVVGSTISPGRVLGKAWVPKGESRDVLVKLSLADGARASVSLHVDRGTPRTYEFDAERPIRSPDALVYTERRPVESEMVLSALGAEAPPGTALLQVEDQRAGVTSLRVEYATVPGPSWLSVTSIRDDAPARVLGRVWRSAGEYQQIVVPLDTATSPGQILVTLHQDAGVRDRFEFDPNDPLGSIDRPYRMAGEIEIKQVTLSAE